MHSLWDHHREDVSQYLYKLVFFCKGNFRRDFELLGILEVPS